MVQMDDLLFILLTLVSLTSAEAANQIIIRRGFLPSTFVLNDFFNYTAKICGDNNVVYEWCEKKNGYQVTSLNIPNISSSMCACYCKDEFETFLSREEKCVKISYLKSLGDFGNGRYQFLSFADFTQASSIKPKGNYWSNRFCNQCVVETIKYFNKDEWKLPIQHQLIRIQSNCMLSWNSSHKELVGKILKIQLHCCQKNELNRMSFFLKSNGSYVIDVTTPTLSTVTATISSSMDSTEIPTFSSSSTSTSAMPTPALITTSHQVSECVTSLHNIQVSPTKAIRASSYAWSSGGTLFPSSSSAAVLLPTIPPTKSNPDHQSAASSSTTWTITAVVVACIVVGGIVVVLVVLRRRNSCDRARSSGNSAKMPVADSTGNPMYGHNQGEVITLPNRLSQPQKVEDEEYDYATVDGGHSDPQKASKPQLYQSLVKENIIVRDSVYTPLNKEATETPVDYLYNHLQHPQYNPPRSKSDPLYNTLEPPNNDEYMVPETQISDNQLGGPEPVYNVLEGPDDDYDNAPLDDDENLPASGQDNVAYSSTIDLRKAQSPSSPDYDVLEGPKGTLQDSTYQPLGVRAQDDVYQPLDRTSQPIYQSLEPNDSMA